MDAGYHTGGGSGGLGAEKPADPKVQAVCDSRMISVYKEAQCDRRSGIGLVREKKLTLCWVKAEFLKESGVNATTFKAVKYTSQVVAGTNYFVKVSLGGDHFCHLRIYQPLPHTGEKAELNGFQMGKTEADAIVHF